MIIKTQKGAKPTVEPIALVSHGTVCIQLQTSTEAKIISHTDFYIKNVSIRNLEDKNPCKKIDI